MTPSVVIVTQPQVDFNVLLGLSHKLLGYSPATKVDETRREFSDTERYISCLAALRDQNAPAGITPNLLTFASFGILIVAEERDMLDIIEAASGIPVVLAETVNRGAMLAILSGTLAQWRDAVKSGASPAVEYNVRLCFCQIMSLFERINLGHVWKEFTIKPQTDHTFYLEDKRRG
jgi:hypothetical protein